MAWISKKWATLETTGTDGTTIRQKNWDADHAKKTAENLRQSKDIKSVKVVPQDRGPW